MPPCRMIAVVNDPETVEAVNEMAMAAVHAPETVKAVNEMAMDGCRRSYGQCSAPCSYGHACRRPMREVDTPGADRPGIAAFASVNALVERKAAIQAMIVEMNARIVELRRDAETSMRVLEDEKTALQEEAL